jgi:ribosomal protein L32
VLRGNLFIADNFNKIFRRGVLLMAAEKTKKRSIKDSPCGSVSGPEAFMHAHEEVENAYDALLALEGEFQCAAAGQISKRHCGENKLLHSLNMECVNYLARQKMVTSPEWQAAWERFERAVIAHQATMQGVRGQLGVAQVTEVTITKVTVRKASSRQKSAS